MAHLKEQSLGCVLVCLLPVRSERSFFNDFFCKSTSQCREFSASPVKKLRVLQIISLEVIPLSNSYFTALCTLTNFAGISVHNNDIPVSSLSGIVPYICEPLPLNMH